MKRDLYLDKYIRLLEVSAQRAYKDLERERKRVDFIEGKIERLELVVMESKSDAGREYAERTDRAAPRPPITKVRADQPPVKQTFAQIREEWNSLSLEQQEKKIAEGMEATKERPA
jgi:hypothetical protein